MIRYIYTDWDLHNDTTYSVFEGGLDSLTVNYLGFRCEHELTAFVSYPHWLSVLSTGEWFLWFLPWGVLGLLAAFYAWLMMKVTPQKLSKISKKEANFVINKP